MWCVFVGVCVCACVGACVYVCACVISCVGASACLYVCIVWAHVFVDACVVRV